MIYICPTLTESMSVEAKKVKNWEKKMKQLEKLSMCCTYSSTGARVEVSNIGMSSDIFKLVFDAIYDGNKLDYSAVIALDWNGTGDKEIEAICTAFPHYLIVVISWVDSEKAFKRADEEFAQYLKLDNLLFFCVKTKSPTQYDISSMHGTKACIIAILQELGYNVVIFVDDKEVHCHHVAHICKIPTIVYNQDIQPLLQILTDVVKRN